MNSDFRRKFWIVLGVHVVLIALFFLLSIFHRKSAQTVTWLDGGANHAAQSADAQPTPTPDADESPVANHEPKKSQSDATPKMTVSEREKVHRIEPSSEIVIPAPTPRATPVATPKPTPTPLSTPIPEPTPKETPTPKPTPDLKKIEAEKKAEERRKEHLAELKREREKERAEEKARAAEKERDAEKSREEAAEKRKREEWLKEQAAANAEPKPKPKSTPHHHAANHEVAHHAAKPKSTPKKTPTKAKPKSTPKNDDDSANDEAAKAARAKFLKSQGDGTANDEGSAAGRGGGDRGGAGHKNGGKKASDFSDYWAKLKDRFDARWEQPTSIIKSDQQFVTTVHFKIAKDGTILNASLAHSSGMSIMDESVMSAARQVKKVDPLPEGLTDGDSYDININFQLH